MYGLKYGHLLYKRGYLFSQDKVEPPVPSWQQKAIGSYFISFDPDNQFDFVQDGANWVAILGRMIDTLHWSLDKTFISRKCLDQLNLSEEKMLDYIDHLSGRFILIYHHSNKTKFMTDAFGTRSAFYSLQDPVLIASHCRIISDYLKLEESAHMATIKRDQSWSLRSSPIYGYPGILTPFEGLYILTPNTLINVEERKINRFYPRKELRASSLDSVVKEVSDMLKRQLGLLRREYNLAISLSAGIDTRTTLAAARDIVKDVLFFTYGDLGYLGRATKDASCVADTELAGAIARMYEWRRQTLETDLLIASEITQALELRHIRLTDVTVREEDFQQFSQILNRNNYLSHGLRQAREYLEHLPPDVLHIRSNVGESGRAFYRKHGFSDLPLIPERMARAWHKGLAGNEAVVEAFLQFAEVTRFNEIMNYDPYDMFHWEHKQGTWYSLVLLETDVAFDTFTVYNCRVLAEKMLSVPVEQRIKSVVHHEIIRHLWPLLLHWPINQMPFNKQLESALAERDKLGSQLQAVRSSFSYRLGYILVQAVRKPGRNTLLLPYRVLQLALRAVKKISKGSS